MFFNGWESAKNRPREQEFDALRTLTEGEDGLSPFQLVDISKLGLNSKIKKFSYSFICGKGYSPPFGGRIAFCLQSEHAVRRVFLAPARKNDVLRVTKFEKR